MSLTKAISAGARSPELYVYAARIANATISAQVGLTCIDLRTDSMPTSCSAMYGIVATMPVIATSSAMVDEPDRARTKSAGVTSPWLARHRPQPDEHDEDQRVDHDRVRHRVEPDRAGREQQRRYGDERVRGVEVAADQEPGDPGSELAAAQTPFVDVRHRGRPLPAGREEADDRDREEDDRRDDDLGQMVLTTGHLRSLVSW